MSLFPHGLSALAALLVTIAGATAAGAAPITYVHPNASGCGGNTPCYRNMHTAIQNVNIDGTVIVLASLADNIFQTFSKTGITVRGINSSVAINGGVSVTGAGDVVTGWTIRDLVFNNSITIQDVAVSLTLQNLSTTGVRLGEFTQETNAAIDVSDVTFPGGPASEISILGGAGADIAGSITVADNVNAHVLNIWSRTSTSNAAHISADITVSGNQLLTGTNIEVITNSTGGVGNVTGTVQFLDNVMSPTLGALGIIVIGPGTGTITGPVVFTGNSGKALVLNTTESAGGGIGSVQASGNDLEAIEIDAKGPLTGPILITGNHIVDKGSGAPEPPKIQADGHPVSADVTIDNTTGGDALISTTSVAPGNYSGLLRIRGNDCRRIVVDSQGGPIVQAFTITDNVLAPGTNPDSSLTIRTLSGGSIAGGTLSDNELDMIQFDLSGGLAGGLSISTNIVREQSAFINSGPVGPGTSTLEGNNLGGLTYLQGITSVATFNRIFNAASIVAGASVDARYNWWGCNGGPGAPGCTTLNGSAPVTPWLTFTARTRCTSTTSATQTLDLWTASDATKPAGNVTPGSATVTTSQGTVNPSAVPLIGSGSTTLTLPPGATPVITSRLDSASVILTMTAALSCSVSDIQLSNGMTKTDSIIAVPPQDIWKYYSIQVPTWATQLNVALDPMTGDVDLYVRAGIKPDAGTYDCAPNLAGTAGETCSFTNPAAGTWWIGIRHRDTGTADYRVTATFSSWSAQLYTLAPCRVADTRRAPGPSGGPALAANTTRTFPVGGICGVPATAAAVAINLTVVDETDMGDLRVYPAGSPPPGSSAINFSAGQVRANSAIIPLGTGGQISVHCDMPPNSPGQTHFLFDVTGYFE